jgi:hypothetical protein
MKLRLQYHCNNERRRQSVRKDKSMNGIDYLEVLDQHAPDKELRQQTLLVYLFKPVPDDLSAINVEIYGGVRITQVNVEWAVCASDYDSLIDNGLISEIEHSFFQDLRDQDNSDHLLLVRTDTYGDYSTYRLCLVRSPTDPSPPDNFDPILSSVDFSFKVECKGDFDCKAAQKCPPEYIPEPLINYQAKDYASFRQLMLDRLSLIMPDWKERNTADLGIVLVELLAYVGDYLSYYQDAVATEAYLNTARKRISIRRHSRLLDYTVHDGCNSRVWVCFEITESSPVYLKKEDEITKQRTRLLTSCIDGPVVEYANWEKVVEANRPEVFELMHDVSLYPAHNHIFFYTWDSELCCLPKGATSATLCDNPDNRLMLRSGDVLIFEERLGTATGENADADPAHRHAVRLIDVYPEAQIASDGTRTPAPVRTDSLTGQAIVEIKWHYGDALPFPLCISTLISGMVIADMAWARGNVVLADQGRTIENELLSPEVVPDKERYRPHLLHTNIIFCSSYDHDKAQRASAYSATAQEPIYALPAVELNDNGDLWSPVRDLLNSDRFALEFVVEMEDDATAHLRFGDDVLGRKPAAGAALKATYRVSSGTTGNLGAGAITHVVPVNSGTNRIIHVRNPLPAQGKTEAEKTEQVRIYAPHAFRSQQRAVTQDDYAKVAQRHFEVQKAVATLRWTGSWYTMFITVDRKGGRKVDGLFKKELHEFIERFRMAGHDIEIDTPHFVPLDIAFTICVAPGFLRSAVKQALLEKFSNTDLPDGRQGFFHPDNFTFGQSVYLSHIAAAAMQVPGVLWIDTGKKPAHRFTRLRQPSSIELDEGMITFERLEIMQLDNDPNAPENGKIEFFMEGGL